MKVCLVLLALIAVASCADVPCDVCLQVMDEGLNILLNEILNGGVIGGCDYLCHYMPDTVLELGCNLLCDFVGIKEFVNIINGTDPDPIFYCQELHACPKSDAGPVIIPSSTSTISPPSGPIGTVFKLTTTYAIARATNFGLQTISVFPPSDSDSVPIYYTQVTLAQSPGSYTLEQDIFANINFDIGKYDVDVILCEGECTLGGTTGVFYAQSRTSFTVTD